MKYIIGSIAVVAALFGATATAQGAGDIISDQDCCTFVEDTFTQVAGEVPNYVNPAGSDSVHNVTATQTGAGGKPIFESKTISAGESTPVDGVQYLSDGTYPFICSIHGSSMSGDLVISGGTPLVRPKPKVKVSVPSQKLKKVQRTGKIKVKVKGVTDASGIKLKISKGKKTFGSLSKISVSAGTTKKVTVKLTGKGKKAVKKAVKKGKKLRLQAKATVPGGKSAKAKRTLR
ncbi:MAG: hypothetical protein IPK93_02035 [Solirubrobacterales bacterium]|nr:hypothetical protein [Solirubrobacterales bacterium]